MLEEYSIEGLRRAGLQGGMAILDQGVFSGSNFVFGILLARWLPPVEYGAYALAFAFLLILYQLHQSLITDPMGVLGPANYPSRLRAYLLTELKMHFAATVPFGLLGAAAAFAVALVARGDTAVVARNLGLMSLCIPLVLLPWFLRRGFYVLRQPMISALGSMCYGVGLLAMLLVLRHTGALSSLTAILAIGAAGAISGALLFLALSSTDARQSPPGLRAVFVQNWAYARWLVAAGFLMVLAGQMQVLLAGRILGVSAAGIVDVLQSFSQPMILIIGAITAITTPALSTDFSRGSIDALRRKVTLVTVALFCAALVFESALFVFRSGLEQLLYGGKFAQYVDLIPVFGLAPVMLALYWGPAIGLQAAQRPQALLIVACVWAPSSVLITTWLTDLWGLAGAALSSALGYLIIVAVCWYLYGSWVRRAVYAV